jgi:hypothetical protein
VQVQLSEEVLLYLDELLVQRITLLRRAHHKHLNLQEAEVQQQGWPQHRDKQQLSGMWGCM